MTDLNSLSLRVLKVLVLLSLSNVEVDCHTFRREYYDGAGGVSVDPMKFVPPDFTEAFRGFASDLVANEIFVEHSNTFGASAAYTFGVGQLLAVLNERMFSLPNDGFDEALRTEFGSITTAYKDMTESLMEDSSVDATNTLYTSNRTLEPTDGAKALMTNVYYQDFSQPHVAVPSINARIAIQTFTKIYDKLIPNGGWYGPSIYSFTKGLFVNTFFYKNKFLFPFTDIGKQFFVTDRVRMLATAGNFKIRRTQEFTTITLPFKDKRKSLVLVLPKGDLQDVTPYLESALDSTKPDGFVETKPLIVQIPALNFTVSTEFFSQLYYMGMNNSMCNWNAGHPYFLQPPAQASYYYLDSDKFEVASATGVQLNNNREFQEITGIKSKTPIRESQPRNEPVDQSDDIDIDITTSFPNRLRSSPNDEEIIDLSIESAEHESVESGHSGPTKKYKFLDESHPTETIRFDKPFYWYLQDEVLGPVFVGIVNSFKTYKEQVSSIDDIFDDMFKYQFWSCGTKHLALIDMYTSGELEQPANNE